MPAAVRAMPVRASARGRDWSRSERWWVAAGALIVFGIELWAIGVPSFWYDEAATFSGASRSWESLADMVGQIDAVHGLFYALMHPLVHAVGADPIAMRGPSALAIALTAATTYVITRERESSRTAAAASLVLVGLARTSWMATEARSFALATLVATVLSLILLRALRAAPGRATVWIVAYAAVATFGVYLYVYLALILAAHGLTVLLCRPERLRALGMLGSMALAGLLSVPLLVLVTSQRNQLGGTFPIGGGTWSHVFVSQLFHRQHLQAAIAWVLMGVALIIWLWRSRSTPLVLSHAPRLVALVVPWLALPTMLIVVFSALSPTIYQPRALVISAPAFCILFAVALQRAFGSPAALIGAGLIVALGVPAFFANRELTAKGSDWPTVVEHLNAEVQPGDGILYSTPVDYHSWPSLMRLMHPDPIARFDDVALRTPYLDRPALFDERVDIAMTADRLRSLDRVWFVRSLNLDAARSQSHVSTMASSGLVLVSTWRGPKTVVEEWVRPDG